MIWFLKPGILAVEVVEQLADGCALALHDLAPVSFCSTDVTLRLPPAVRLTRRRSGYAEPSPSRSIASPHRRPSAALVVRRTPAAEHVVVDQLRDRRVVAAEHALRVACGCCTCAELHRQRVVEQQAVRAATRRCRGSASAPRSPGSCRPCRRARRARPLRRSSAPCRAAAAREEAAVAALAGQVHRRLAVEEQDEPVDERLLEEVRRCR